MSRHRRLRDHVPFTPRHEPHFHWRGQEVSRLEGFTDAVFAFAVTLLIVALEVPHTYEGLMNVVRSFPAFVICFALLMNFWSAHYRYFRRFGLEDTFTRIATMGILVLVLFAVYPLKFLFTLVTSNVFHLAIINAPHLESWAEVQMLYTVYGLGFAGVWAFYALMYAHALKRRHQLELTPAEIILTRHSLRECLIYIAVCGLSILLVQTREGEILPGIIYCVLGPLQAFNGWWHSRQVRALTGPSPA